MPLHVNDEGVWKTPEVWLNDNGIWKRPEVWVNDAGVWKLAASPVTAITVTASPTSRSESSLQTTRTFTVVTVSVAAGTANTNTWGFVSIVGGLWSVFSGQGTNVARAHVSGVDNGTQASATFYCDVVVNGQTYRVTCPHTFESILI